MISYLAVFYVLFMNVLYVCVCFICTILQKLMETKQRTVLYNDVSVCFYCLSTGH